MNLKLDNLKVDKWICFPIIALSLFSLLVIYSASYQSMAIVNSQFFKILLGFFAFTVISNINPHTIRLMGFKFYVVVLAMLIFVDVLGHTAMGAQRWLNLGIINVQPSEFMKLAIPMMFGWLIFRYGMPRTLKMAFLYSFLMITPIILILMQPDLGTAILVFLSGMFLLFQAGLSYRFIGYSLMLTLTAIPLAYNFLLKEYQRKRIETLFNPELDPLGSGYHVIQSKIAIGSGGFWGKGFLEGTQTHLGFIPEQKTDFIFAVLGEEFGMFGWMIIMALYLIIIFRVINIILKAKDMYEKLVSGSILMMFVSYIFVNLGMVMGILPVVGVPLPFMSFGGTSILTLMVSFGIISSFSTHYNKNKVHINNYL